MIYEAITQHLVYVLQWGGIFVCVKIGKKIDI